MEQAPKGGGTSSKRGYGYCALLRLSPCIQKCPLWLSLCIINALLTGCHALKVPFSWTLYHALLGAMPFWGLGETLYDISTCDLSPERNPEKHGRPMKSNAVQLGLGSSRPESNRPGSSWPGPKLSLVGMCLIKRDYSA